MIATIILNNRKGDPIHRGSIPYEIAADLSIIRFKGDLYMRAFMLHDTIYFILTGSEAYIPDDWGVALN